MECSHNQKSKVSKLYEECLDGDYIICDKCDGVGEYHHEKWKFKVTCDKCWGDGKLDWIEKIMGKECPWNESGMSSSSTSSVSSSYTSTTLPTQKAISVYLDEKKRRKDDHKNFIRRRTVQRFHQMSNKLKRCMQRR